MAAQIRDYNPSTDADRVAEFFNRSHYGPARDSGALTGSQLNLTLAERGVHLFLIAEDRGRIIGTIGYLRVSGRRVSRDDELFAGMFVIDPGYRAGFLAGRLFTSSFGRLLDDGIASLRVEVNPANAKAFPLYIRVGFRSATPHPQPDQDGYIELVSHLPGVVSRLLRDLASDVPLRDAFSSFSWRTLAGGRTRSIGHGVTTHDTGDVHVEYEFMVRGDSLRVTVRMHDGGHVATTINGEAVVGPDSVAHGHAPSLTPRHTVSVGDYSVELDTGGTVSVRHPSYFGPVYRDALASVLGRPLAWRRPAQLDPLVTEDRGGWLLAWQVDEVRLQKSISIQGDTITTVVRSEPARGLLAEPWSSIRGSVVHGYSADSDESHSLNVPGLWPLDAVDFEGSREAELFVMGSRTVIDEAATGMRLEFAWLEAESVRVEGQPLGRAMTSGSELRYSLRLGATGGDREECRGKSPAGVAWMPATAAPRARHVRRGDGPNWTVETLGGHTTAVARGGSDTELVVAPLRGIASWRVEGADVLMSPFPSSRTLGPLDNWDSGLWVSTQGGREDFEHGVGWGGYPRIVHSAKSAENEAFWSVDVLDDSVSAIRLNLMGGDSPPGDETIAHLTPKVWGPRVFIAADPTGWWELQRTGRRWFCFARAARIPLGDDRVLSIAADAADDELLIRSSAGAFLVSLISRVAPSGSTWSLSVEKSEGEE